MLKKGIRPQKLSKLLIWTSRRSPKLGRRETGEKLEGKGVARPWNIIHVLSKESSIVDIEEKISLG